MKRTIEITETKKVEIDIPPFFKTSESCYYMMRDTVYVTQVWAGGIIYHTSIEMRTIENVLSGAVPITEITMEEFYSKLNEAFNILSIGSHEVKETEGVLNNWQQSEQESEITPDMIAESQQFES